MKKKTLLLLCKHGSHNFDSNSKCLQGVLHQPLLTKQLRTNIKRRQSRTAYQLGQIQGMGREVTSLTAQPWLRCLGGDLLCTWPDAQTATPGHVSQIFLSLLHVLVDLIQALFYAVQLFCPCGGDGGGQQEGESKEGDICKHAHTKTYKVPYVQNHI